MVSLINYRPSHAKAARRIEMPHEIYIFLSGMAFMFALGRFYRVWQLSRRGRGQFEA